MIRFSVSHLGYPDVDASSLSEAQAIIKRKRGTLSTWGPWRKENRYGQSIEWRRADWRTASGKFGGVVVEQREAGSDLKRAKRRASKRSTSKRKRPQRRRTARTRLRKKISRRRTMSLPRGFRFEVIESKRWVNTKNGSTASIYGASPWTSAAEKNDWQLQNAGWTLRDNNTGIVGVGRQPWASKQEAQEAANKFNNR